MDRTITASEANRAFSRMLGEVREGRSYVITAHGKPVARIVPLDADADAKAAGRRRLLDRLRGQPALNLPRFSRDDFYE